MCLKSRTKIKKKRSQPNGLLKLILYKLQRYVYAMACLDWIYFLIEVCRLAFHTKTDTPLILKKAAWDRVVIRDKSPLCHLTDGQAWQEELVSEGHLLQLFIFEVMEKKYWILWNVPNVPAIILVNGHLKYIEIIKHVFLFSLLLLLLTIIQYYGINHAS